MLPVILLMGLGLFWATGALLPAELTVRRTVEIEAAPGRVYAHVDGVESWRQWYVGPDAKVRQEGASTGSGGALIRTEEDGTENRFELTETSSPTAVSYRYHRVEDPEEAVRGRLEVEATTDGKSRVTLEETGRAAGVSFRWILYVAGDRMVGSMLERLLHNLKSLVETGKTHPVPSESSSQP